MSMKAGEVARPRRAQPASRARRLTQIVIAVMAFGWAAGQARADDEFISAFVPGVIGVSYQPAKGEPWTGAGFSLSLVQLVSRNHHSVGLGFDIAVLGGAEPGRRMTVWRITADSSFERTARRALVPYWSMAMGEIVETALGKNGTFDAAVGVHLVRTEDVALDVEAGGVLPFSAADRLAGSKLTARLSFRLR